MWWLASRRRKGEDMTNALNSIDNSIAKLHKRMDDEVDEIDKKYATKEYVDQQDNHIKEINGVQFSAIMENLAYIRKRVDEQNKPESK